MSSPTDFDFFIGHWSVRHTRLKDRLKGSQQWEEFTGTSTCYKTLGGLGNVDDNFLELPGNHYRAITIRSFDPKEKTWSIWWLDGRNPHQLDTPVIGRFENGVGTFLANDKLDGKNIIVRFRWHASGPQPKWEQAFSDNNGATWETNWVMEFSPC